MIITINNLIKHLEEIRERVQDGQIKCIIPALYYRHAVNGEPHQIEFYDKEQQYEERQRKLEQSHALEQANRELADYQRYF